MDNKTPCIDIEWEILPVTRLKASVATWQEVSDNKYILDVVSCGYKPAFTRSFSSSLSKVSDR